jgi:uncharacterized membrane protein
MNGELNGAAALILLGAGMLLGILASATWFGGMARRQRRQAEKDAWAAANRYYAAKAKSEI